MGVCLGDIAELIGDSGRCKSSKLSVELIGVVVFTTAVFIGGGADGAKTIIARYSLNRREVHGEMRVELISGAIHICCPRLVPDFRRTASACVYGNEKVGGRSGVPQVCTITSC